MTFSQLLFLINIELKFREFRIFQFNFQAVIQTRHILQINKAIKSMLINLNS